jgi:hypothetical protein
VGGVGVVVAVVVVVVIVIVVVVVVVAVDVTASAAAAGVAEKLLGFRLSPTSAPQSRQLGPQGIRRRCSCRSRLGRAEGRLM